jgi:hypothetical protein
MIVRFVVMKWLCQTRNVFVCKGYEVWLFLRVFYWIVELFRKCSILVFRHNSWSFLPSVSWGKRWLFALLILVVFLPSLFKLFFIIYFIFYIYTFKLWCILILDNFCVMILHISCILFMIIAFLMITMFTWFYVRVDIVLTCTASFH